MTLAFPPQPNFIIRATAATFIIIRSTAAPLELRHFEFASRSSADPALFAALQAAIHDNHMMSQLRAYFATWEHIDVTRMDDSAVIGILRKEIDWHQLAAYRVTDEAYLPVWTADPAPIPPPTGPVSNWSVSQKLSAMFQAMPDFVAPALRGEVAAFVSPENIALIAAFGAAIAAAQAVPGADAAVDALILAVGWATFGWAGLCAAWDFAKAMIRAGGATSKDEIRLAAQLAVAALVSIGIMLFLHKLSAKLKRNSGDTAPPKSDAPPDKGRPRPQRPEDLPGAAKGPQQPSAQSYLYRGVKPYHPNFADYEKGNIVPGNVDGTVTADEHNLFGDDPFVQAQSPYTSWSTDPTLAAGRAGPDGLLLRVPTGAPPPGATWSWEWSPDQFGESEMLLRGIRTGAEVVPK